MKTDRLQNLFMELQALYSNLVRYKLQQKTAMGFNNKVKLDKLSKLLEKSKAGINRYSDIGFNEDSKENPKELVTLLKTLAKIDDFLPQLPEKAQDELFSEIREDITRLIEQVSSYNYLEEPELLIV